MAGARHLSDTHCRHQGYCREFLFSRNFSESCKLSTIPIIGNSLEFLAVFGNFGGGRPPRPRSHQTPSAITLLHPLPDQPRSTINLHQPSSTTLSSIWLTIVQIHPSTHLLPSSTTKSAPAAFSTRFCGGFLNCDAGDWAERGL